MASERLIDRNERTRSKPMRVLVLGMCRTGTSTVAVALRKLGYTPHQMRNVLANPSELALWQEAINVTLLPPQDRPTSQQNKAPYGRPEFDKLLGDFDAVTDLPGCIFSKELVEAYPDAKVILTNRKYTDWESSMQESIWCLDTWHLFRLCRQLNMTQLAPLTHLVHSAFQAHNGNQYGGPGAKSAFEKHYDTVRSSVPKDQLLELDMDAEMDWDALCGFLGKEIPKESFPTVTEERAMRKGLDSAWWGMVQYFFLLFFLPGCVIIASYFLFMHADTVWEYRDALLVRGKNYLDTGKW